MSSAARVLGILTIVVLHACALAAERRAQPSTVVVLVRHAEKAASTDADPPLSVSGESRARELAEVLADARIDCIITSQFRRTRQTAMHLARALGLEPLVISAGADLDAHVADVAAAIRERPAGGAILVVGHSNTIPAIIGALGGPAMGDLDETEYASLFTLVLPATGTPRLVRASYGAADPIPWQGALGYKPTEIFPISLGKYGYPYLRVWVDGEQLEVAIDTANMSGLLLAPGVAERLGLSVVGDALHYDSDGEVLGRSRVFGVERFETLGEVWRDQRAVEYMRDDVDGYIGPRYFLGKRITLDYRRRVVAVSDSPLPLESPPGTVLELVESPHYEGLIVVRAAVNGHPVLAEVDTGKSRTCVDPRLAGALELPAVEGGYRIDEIRLGTLTFTVASAKAVGFGGISEGLPGPIGIGIGSDIISQMVLTVDYARWVILVAGE